MSLPIGSVAAIGRVFGSARQLAQSVQENVSFDKILNANGASPSQATSEREPTQSLLARTIDAIRQRLSGAGLESSLPLGMQLRGDGGVMLEAGAEEHVADQAAAIEALLAGDPVIRDLVSQLAARVGETKISVDLNVPEEAEKERPWSP